MKRICIERGCVHYAMRGPRCNWHTRQRDMQRQARRGDRYGGDYRTRRAATLAETPYCVYCGSTERLTADHVGDELVTACLSCNVKRANKARARKPQGVWGGRSDT